MWLTFLTFSSGRYYPVQNKTIGTHFFETPSWHLESEVVVSRCRYTVPSFSIYFFNIYTIFAISILCLNFIAVLLCAVESFVLEISSKVQAANKWNDLQVLCETVSFLIVYILFSRYKPEFQIPLG